MDFSGDVRRGAVKIEVLANKLRKQMEIDLAEYPDSRALAIELRNIYEALAAFSTKVEAVKVDNNQSIWATEAPAPAKGNIISFKKLQV